MAKAVSHIDHLLNWISLSDERDGPNVVAFQPNVMVIKKALSNKEQCEVFEIVEANKTKSSKNIKNANNKHRYGHFMRLNLSDTQKFLQKYAIYDQLFQKMIEIVNTYNNETFGSMNKSEIHKLKQKGLLNYNMLDMDLGKIKQRYINSLYYKAPNGMISKHCDKKKEIIFLYSLGCTALFFVKGKSMNDGLVFDFESGDCLIFDASKNADVVHGIDSIQADSCPQHLQKYSFLTDSRICVQTRCQF